MTTCETLPLTPDLEISDEPVVTEPMEVGPFREGVVFVKIHEGKDDPELTLEIGISPTGYDDWEAWWTPIRTEVITSGGVHAFQLQQFGNWLRLRVRNDGEDATVLAWFVGK